MTTTRKRPARPRPAGRSIALARPAPTQAAPAGRTIRIALHGRLRRRFGAEFNLGVSTPAAAVYALARMVPGFREELALGEYRVRRGTFRGGVDLPFNALNLQIPPGGEMHIIPAAKGSKGGSGKIIIGAVLVIAAVVLMQPEVIAGLGLTAGTGATGVLGTTLFGGFTIGSLALMGGAMILTGILMAISPQPKPSNAQDQSFLMSGMTNTSAQGSPVPVVYGLMRVGSVTVSVGYAADEWYPYNGVQNPGETFAPPPGGTSLSGGTLQVAGNTGAMDATGSGGGGKGAGGGGAYNAPDTLHSNATVRIIDVLSEGPIGGLVNGAQSIFFNGTPLGNADGSWNFRGVTWEVRLGYPDQDPVQGFPASETSIVIGRQVKHGNPVTQTIASTSVTSCRVTMQFPALFKRDNSSGDITPTSVSYQIEVRPSGTGWTGSWATVGTFNLGNAKSMSAYQRSHRFGLPLDNNANSWEVRVTRVSPDSTDIVNLQNDTYFEYIDLIDDHKLIYPNTAYICYTFDARLFGTSLPQRQVEIYGRTIDVPRNYDPVTRIYNTSGPGTSSGTWDLVSVIQRPSSNAAWVLLDMLTSDRYGCGLSDAYVQTTRADLYQIAQYCDGLVPDGFGGWEARYTIDTVIATQDDAYRVLQLMAGAFRGTTYWGQGQIMAVADMPRVPVKLVNQTNVVDGQFEYQSTSLQSRHNIINVQYLDSSNRYIPAIEMVSDVFDIARRGVFATDLIAWGCKTRSLAHRLGKWALYTENNQTETVIYKGGPYHMDALPGDVIKLSDPAYAGARLAGRLRARTLSAPAGVVYLDVLFQPDPAATYSLSVVMADGSIDDLIPILSFASTFAVDNTPGLPMMTESGSQATTEDGNAGNAEIIPDTDLVQDYAMVQLARPLAGLPSANAEYIITSSAVAPREFAILALSEDGKGTLSVTALNYEPGKYSFIELGIAFDSTPYSLLPGLLVLPLPPPTNVGARDYMTGVGVSQTVRVTVSWTAPLDARITQFEVMASSANYLKISPVGWTCSVDLDGLTVGDAYSFAVRSLGVDGKSSVWASAVSTIVVDGKVDPPGAPLGLTATGGTRRIQLTWSAVAGRRDILQYEIWRNSSPNPPGAGATLLSVAGGLSYLDADSVVLRPNTTMYYWVRAIALGTPLVPGAYAGPASAATTLLIVDDLADAIINAAKFAQSITPVRLVANLNTVNDLDGVPVPVGGMATATSDSKLYRRVTTGTGTSGSGLDWVAVVNTTDIQGLVSNAQIAAVAASKVTGQLTAAQILSLTAAQVSGQLSDTQLAAISAAKVTGTLSDAQLAAISASKITGQLTNAQIAALDAAKLTGTITGPQILSVTAGQITGQLTNAQLAAIDAAKITGAITASQIATGTITAGQIAAGTITATQLSAGSVTTSQLSAGAVTASTIAANTITASQIASGTITATQLSANSVTASQIVAGAVTAGKIAAASITSTELSANSVTASQLVAGAVTAGKIAASSITSTELSANSVTASQIVAGAVTAGKIAASAVTATELSAGAVTAVKVSAGAVTTAALAVGSASNLCWNSCLQQSADGWNFGGNGTITAGAWASASWELTGFGSGYITTSILLATNSTQIIQGAWDPNGFSTAGLGIPWTAGQMIEVQAQLMTHRCCARVQIDFYTVAGVLISTVVGNRVTATPVNDGTLSSYRLSYLITAAPATTARARASVVGYNDGGADIATQSSPPFLFFTQFAVGASVPNATAPAPWVNGGLATIAGGMIQAASIQSASIATGAIQAGNIATGAVTAGKISALSITSAELAANSIVSGKIATGAISASEIAANTIHATMLASDFQLTNSAQIGTAVIQTAHIGALQVDTSNIATDAISSIVEISGAGTQSLTIVSNGWPVLLWGMVIFDGVNWQGVNADLRLSRGGGYLVRMDPTMTNVSASLTNPCAVLYTESPGFGTFTYTLTANNLSRTISPNITLMAIALKK